MKKIAMILSAILISSVSFAQSVNGVKGPKAKNYKPWKNQNSEIKVMVTKENVSMNSPQAKNYKPWNENNNATSGEVVLMQRKERPMGPKAKNQKPWKS